MNDDDRRYVQRRDSLKNELVVTVAEEPQMRREADPGPNMEVVPRRRTSTVVFYLHLLESDENEIV